MTATGRLTVALMLAVLAVPSSYALDTGEWHEVAYQPRAQIESCADLVQAS